MKKVLANLILINILAILLLPSLVSAAVPPPRMAVPPPRSPQFAAAAGGIEIKPPITITTIPELVEVITNWAFWLGMVLAPLMILVGAFYFLTAAGDPKRIATGKKVILWTIVGLGIILFSKVIISIIESILKGTP